MNGYVALGAGKKPPFLSPFHREILSFLESNAERVEAASQYHFLFGARESVHLERLWMGACSEEEFARLGLGAYFPKVYRGLPRLYHRNDPGCSYVKKNFTDLSLLRKLSIERALFSLYEGVALPREMRVSIFTWGLSDGQEAALVLREKMPHLDVQLVEIPHGEKIPFEAIQRLCSSNLILEIVDVRPQLKGLLGAVAPRIETIGKCGFLERNHFHPGSNNCSMGLHALEKGIFVHKGARSSFSEIEQRELVHWLFGTSIPGPAEIDAYEQGRHFFLAHLATPIGGAIYLHALLKMHERDVKDIDLCSPDPGWLFRWIEERDENSLPILEDAFGVKEILIVAFGRSHRRVLKETGKTLRVFCPGPLSALDMRRLYTLSGEWVGVSCDQSFSEAVSAGKTFFYDGQPSARYFFKDLLAFAENRLISHRSALQAFRMLGQAFLWNLPPEPGEWVEESHFQRGERWPWFRIAHELGNCLSDPDAIVGFKKLCLMIGSERSFNVFLKHLVQRRLIHILHSEIASFEKEQTDLYLAGNLSFSSLVKNHQMMYSQVI